MRLRDLDLLPSRKALGDLPEGKLLVCTVNAWSFVTAQKDADFARVLRECDVLLPDGESIVRSCRFLHLENAPAERVAGWDCFIHEMGRLEKRGGKCLFAGSTPAVLAAIRERARKEHPHIEIDTYSPPFKPEFSPEEDRAMVDYINASDPDLLWIGMTAPRQEKWLRSHWDSLTVRCHCGAVGAVFDFYAGTARRAPEQWQRRGLEWLYRLLREPRRMARRYLVGNPLFVYYVLRERFSQ